jgi:hypothetical protein
METQFAARAVLPAASQVAGALAAAHTQARPGVSGYAIRPAFPCEGGTGVVVHHVDFDHDGAPYPVTAEATRTAIGGYAATLTAAGFHLRHLRDGLLIPWVTTP